MSELALIIFSICIQAAVGIIVFVCLAKYLDKDGVFKTAVVVAAGLAVIGLLASLLHLGQPLRAVNSLAHFSTSWLSREIWFTGAFTGVTVIAVILVLFKPIAKNAIQALVTLAAIIGLGDIYVMTAVYTSSSVPAWHSGGLFVEFYAATLTMGAVLFLALGGAEGLKAHRPAVLTVGVAVALQVVFMIGYYIQLGASTSQAAGQSLSLMSSMSGVMMIKWLSILLGTGLLFFPVQKRSLNLGVSGEAAAEIAATGTVSASIYFAALLLITGQIIGRYLFYAIVVLSRVGLS
ncbi:MAG: DmsC/YnfH family molybdoenzyme membrane anchor subunit [Bacillota bacterium]